MKKFFCIFILSCLLVLSGCSNTATTSSSSKKQQKNVNLTISAAASLHDVLTTLSKTYEKNHPVHISINSASSGTLAKQIEEGAPSDLFISASKKYMDELSSKKLIDSPSKITLLSNQLVVIQPKKETGPQVQKLSDLKKSNIDNIAIGEPSLVPAGAYAKESLISEHLWKTLQPKYVEGKDVTQALSYVETGNAAAGFVYKSDAVTSNSVKISLTVPDADHKPIVYPAAILKDSKQKNETKQFLTFLSSPKAQKTFKKYGFTPIHKGD